MPRPAGPLETWEKGDAAEDTRRARLVPDCLANNHAIVIMPYDGVLSATGGMKSAPLELYYIARMTGSQPVFFMSFFKGYRYRPLPLFSPHQERIEAK